MELIAPVIHMDYKLESLTMGRQKKPEELNMSNFVCGEGRKDRIKRYISDALKIRKSYIVIVAWHGMA